MEVGRRGLRGTRVGVRVRICREGLGLLIIFGG